MSMRRRGTLTFYHTRFLCPRWLTDCARALFEFHKSQNAKKPGSVHATYLLYGTKPAEKLSHRQHADDAESDVDMDDHYSEDETYSDPFPTVSMTVVTEGALEGARCSCFLHRSITANSWCILAQMHSRNTKPSKLFTSTASLLNR